MAAAVAAGERVMEATKKEQEQPGYQGKGANNAALSVGCGGLGNMSYPGTHTHTRENSTPSSRRPMARPYHIGRERQRQRECGGCLNL